MAECIMCDICGKAIRDDDANSRQFKVKENKRYLIRRYNAYSSYCEGYRSWERIDCHAECIEKLLKTKADTEAKRNGDSRN